MMSLNAHRLLVLLFVMGTSVIGGCASAPKAKQTVLPAPPSTNPAAARHNHEGIHAYEIGQWEVAKQDFEAAIVASPELAEAHFNLGWTLYRLGAMRQGDTHFIEASNLAPGNKVIWDSPPLGGESVPEKESKMPGSNGPGHSH